MPSFRRPAARQTNSACARSYRPTPPGHNGEEYIARVQQGGQDPMAGFITMTSLSAKSLGRGDQIGSLQPGMQADILAMDGNPLTDPPSVRRVEFVMKGGTIFKNDVPLASTKKRMFDRKIRDDRCSIVRLVAVDRIELSTYGL